MIGIDTSGIGPSMTGSKKSECICLAAEEMMRYRVAVPEGRVGDHEVVHFEVDDLRDNPIALFRLLKQQRPIHPGWYTQLIRHEEDDKKTVVMSDTPPEAWEHLPILTRAHGDVLVAGLGIGMVTQALILNPNVTSISVIENSSDVIELVGDFYARLAKKHDKFFEILHESAFDFNVIYTVYDCAWWDIWDQISPDNVPEMDRLRERSKKYVKGYNGMWCEPECREMYEIERSIAWIAKVKSERADSPDVSLGFIAELAEYNFNEAG